MAEPLKKTGARSPDANWRWGRNAHTINRRGYTLTLEGTPMPGSPGGCSGAPAGDGAPAYRAGADSITPINARFFGTNATGTIFWGQVSIYAAMPEFGSPLVGVPID